MWVGHGGRRWWRWRWWWKDIQTDGLPKWSQTLLKFPKLLPNIIILHKVYSFSATCVTSSMNTAEQFWLWLSTSNTRNLMDVMDRLHEIGNVLCFVHLHLTVCLSCKVCRSVMFEEVLWDVCCELSSNVLGRSERLCVCWLEASSCTDKSRSERSLWFGWISKNRCWKLASYGFQISSVLHLEHLAVVERWARKKDSSQPDQI